MSENVIFFEGQDRCLKSTMINRLILTDPNHHYHTIHYGKPPRIANVQQYQERVYNEMFEIISKDASFILDRSHLGEMIWSPIYRNYDSKPFIQEIEKEWYHKQRGEKKIFLFILVDSNFDKWSKRDDGNGLNNDCNFDKHMKEISFFKESLNYTCIESKFLIDLKHWYAEDAMNFRNNQELGDRIDDKKLFDYIYQTIS